MRASWRWRWRRRQVRRYARKFLPLREADLVKALYLTEEQETGFMHLLRAMEEVKIEQISTMGASAEVRAYLGGGIETIDDLRSIVIGLVARSRQASRG